MSFVTYIETIKDVMYDVEIQYGQIIHAVDTNETFFDTEELNRIILDNVIYLNKEEELNLLSRPLTNRVYIVKETATPYRYEGTWYKIKDGNSLLCTIFHNNEFVPTTVMKKGTKIAPRTLASVVYNDLGESITTEIEEVNKLTLCKVKSVYVEATENNQKVFKIPFPLSDYDFRKNFMTVIINGYVVEETRFTIRDDDYFVLNDNETGLDSGQLVLFIFYYNVYIDINDGVLLQTKNLRDRIVTEPKLDNNAVSTRTIIAKNVTNPKLADNAVDTRVLASGAVNSTHLNLNNLIINPENVLETTDDMFVSKSQIISWDNNIQELNRYKDVTDQSIRDINQNISSLRSSVQTNTQDITNLKNEPKLLVSSTEPSGARNSDIWVDTANFIFKVRKDNTWVPMGAVYK